MRHGLALLGRRVVITRVETAGAARRSAGPALTAGARR